MFCLPNKRWLAILNILQLFAQEGDWVGADKYSESFLRRFFVSRILTQDMEIILKDKAFYTWDNKVGVMLIRKYYHWMKHSYTSEKSSQPSTSQWSDIARELSKITLSEYKMCAIYCYFSPSRCKNNFYSSCSWNSPFCVSILLSAFCLKHCICHFISI